MPRQILHTQFHVGTFKEGHCDRGIDECFDCQREKGRWIVSNVTNNQQPLPKNKCSSGVTSKNSTILTRSTRPVPSLGFVCLADP